MFKILEYLHETIISIIGENEIGMLMIYDLQFSHCLENDYSSSSRSIAKIPKLTELVPEHSKDPKIDRRTPRTLQGSSTT